MKLNTWCFVTKRNISAGFHQEYFKFFYFSRTTPSNTYTVVPSLYDEIFSPDVLLPAELPMSPPTKNTSIYKCKSLFRRIQPGILSIMIQGSDGKFLWPGFGENIRVLEWIFQRTNGADNAVKSPIGYIPSDGALNLDGLAGDVNMKELFELPKEFWQKETDEIETYFDEQVNTDLPTDISAQLGNLRDRINSM